MPQNVLPYKIPKMMLTYPYNEFNLGILDANGFDISNILINEFLYLHYYSYKYERIDFGGSGYVEKHRFITKYDIKLKTIFIWCLIQMKNT